MSVTKLLARIVAPDRVIDEELGESFHGNLASTLHDHTYGITSFTMWIILAFPTHNSSRKMGHWRSGMGARAWPSNTLWISGA
jgi:hypothetical protein